MEWIIGIYILGACALAGFLGWIIISGQEELDGFAGVAAWSDNDRYWWRFTYANENRPDGRGASERRLFGLYLTSKGEEDEGGFCLLRGHLLGRTLILRLPQLFGPSRVWVDTTHYEWHRRPGSGYWGVHERSYGFLFQMGSLHVDYGAQTGDSSTDKSKVYFLPWRAWRHIRFSIYGLEGEHIWSQFDRDRPARRAVGFPRENGDALVPGWWDQQRTAQDAAPSATFEFLDYDKERLSAKTQITEREWHLGEGRFKWLSWFSKPKIERSLSIEFSGETGRRKGSWKGGKVGHSISMLPGELHEAAFTRYCAEHQMTFPVPPPAERVEPQDMRDFVNPRALVHVDEHVGDALVYGLGLADRPMASARRAGRRGAARTAPHVEVAEPDVAKWPLPTRGRVILAGAIIGWLVYGLGMVAL